MYRDTIGQLEEQLRLTDTSVTAARDPDISISSANPYQAVSVPFGNRIERDLLRQNAASASQRLASRSSMIYRYALNTHYELKFGGIADEVFSRVRLRVDNSISQTVPDAVQRLTAVYDNLHSDNPEDWSNAVHSCRRILQDLADAVFPHTEEVRNKAIDGKQIEIKLGQEHYINRIMAFIEDQGQSKRSQHLVGSHLSFLGDRLDAIFAATQKGSHATIVDRAEADRYVVYTYLLVGDILSLLG